MRIASYKRLYGKFGQIETLADHMSDNHKLYVEQTRESAVEWAGHIGPSTLIVIHYILDTYQTEKELNHHKEVSENNYGGVDE